MERGWEGGVERGWEGNGQGSCPKALPPGLSPHPTVAPALSLP